MESCELIPFGSGVSGFGVASSDLDLYLDLSNLTSHVKPKPDLLKTLHLHFDDIPGVELTDRGITINSDVIIHQQMKVVERTLSKASKGVFSRSTRLLNARCPVIKTTHCASRILCDVTLNNRLAVQNTRLLKLYSSVSDDIITLIHVLRYWAKRQGVTGSAVTSHPLLTNYALTILIVHFMVNKYSLPSPEKLSQMTDEKTLIDTWDCSFPPMLLPPLPSLPSSPWEMLGDFFKETSTAFKDFDGNVVVSRTGEYKDAASSDFPVGFKICSLNVQDPFDLSHNITQNVNAKSLQHIMNRITQAAELHSKASTDFFPRLLSKAPKPTSTPEKPLVNLSITFDLVMSIWSLPRETLDSAFTAWCEKVTHLTERVLTELLHGDSEASPKRMKKSHEFTACCEWSFTLHMALWVGRKKTLKATEKNRDYFDTELACSRAMLTSEGVILPSPMTFDLKLTPFAFPLERGVKVALTPSVNDGQFKAFSIFFPSFLSKIVDKCVLPQ